MTVSKLRSALDLCVSGEIEHSPSGRPPQNEVLFLFDACGTSLLRYVRSLGVESAAAQDVTQEVFLALFHHLRLGRPRDNLRGWLFKVAHNLALKHRQKLKRREADFVFDVDLAAIVVDPSLDPEQRLAETQRQGRLQAVMRALPELDRQCLSLRAEGLRYRDIAEVLGISLGSVAKSVSRSLSRLANVWTCQRRIAAWFYRRRGLAGSRD
ncbi:MAG: sigma-70 family RNA polymerase sigma factor [Acidobacteria bacterium]|nr:MAG: sigma-70 family RNA polymerase sigma factor [Acidobacteriota bacterium]